MNDAQLLLAYQLVQAAPFRDLIGAVIEDEIVRNCSDMRNAVGAGSPTEAAIAEGRIRALEEFWALLERTARQYKPPTA